TPPRNAGRHIDVRARPRRQVERTLLHHGLLTERDRLACLGRSAATASLRVLAHDWRGAIAIHRDVRVVGLAANIAHLEHHVLGDLALHRQAPLLDGGCAEVGINACRRIDRTGWRWRCPHGTASGRERDSPLEWDQFKESPPSELLARIRRWIGLD